MPEDSKAKAWAGIVKAAARTVAGKALIDGLVERSGYNGNLVCNDQKKQNDLVAKREFIVETIIKPLKRK